MASSNIETMMRTAPGSAIFLCGLALFNLYSVYKLMNGRGLADDIFHRIMTFIYRPTFILIVGGLFGVAVMRLAVVAFWKGHHMLMLASLMGVILLWSYYVVYASLHRERK